MEKRQAVLVDITQCVGCGSCCVACKLWNDIPYDSRSPATGEKPVENSFNWTTLAHQKVENEGAPAWRFVKRQCMHCDEPACVSSCFSKALQKIEQGPVIYHPDKCVGCRYCMLACPFGVPKYEWNKPIPSVSKCQMCSTRIEKGEAPACAAVCPTGALHYGDRDELLEKAKKTISDNKGYQNSIYGEKEAGGTSWLYISDVPFAALGLPTNVPLTALPPYAENYLKWTPPLLIGGTALFAALSIYTRRRSKIAQLEKDAESKPAKKISGEH